MTSIKLVSKKNWDYNLYKVGSEFVLTVIFFDRIDYPRSFRFSEGEIDKTNDLHDLSEDIRLNYAAYESKEITPPILNVGQ